MTQFSRILTKVTSNRKRDRGNICTETNMKGWMEMNRKFFS